MKLRTITLARTVQVRQYEPLALTLSAEIADDEDAGAAYADLLEKARLFFWEATGHQRIEFAPPQQPAELPF